MSTSEIAKLESRWRDNPQGLTFAPLAEAYRKQKDPRRALEVLQPGLERHPDYIPANIVLGRCHWDLGDLEAAEKAFTRVLTLDGENVIALKALADITERQSRPNEAERWLETLLTVDRSNDEARDQLARIRAVQSMSPPIETPAGLDEPVGADMPIGGESISVVGAAVVDPFPAISDELPPPESRADEDTQVPWPAAVDELPGLEPAGVTDLTGPSDAPALSASAADPERPAPLGAADTDDVPPFAAPPLPDAEVFRFERAEEIVLNVASGSEFQVPSAADDLVSTAGREQGAELRSPRDDELAASAASPDEAMATEPDLTSTASLSAEPPPPSALFGSYLPDEAVTSEPPANHAPAFGPPPPAAYEAPTAELLPGGEPAVLPPEPEGSALPPAAAPVVGSGPGSAQAAAGTEPDLVVTETMAQVFLRQGHIVEALAVYRELLTRSSESPHLRDRVADLEERQRVLSAPPLRPSVLARDTGGQSLGSFFETLLGARPHLADSPAEEGGSGMELTPETAPATRPAEEPLSLGSVFGEDPPAIAPAVPPAGSAPAEPPPAAGGDGVSFDDFFAGAEVAAPAPAPPARPARARADDDLDQFHSWLQGLKR